MKAACARAGVWIALVWALSVACGCDASPRGIPVSLHPKPGDPSAPPVDPGTLRMGIGAMISAGATFELYGEFVNQIAAELGRQGVTVQRGSYAEINDLLEQRRLDCALVCTGAYLVGRREFGMEALVVPAFDGTPTYHSIVIVREDSGFEKFEDLRGRRFAFVDPLSNTGRLYPVSRVLYLGSTPEEFFEYQYTHAHDKSIGAVKAGLVDGAAVDELVFNHLRGSDPASVEGLIVIERSPAFGAPPVVVHPDTTPEIRAALRDAFLNLTKRPRGRRVLAELGIDWFTIPPEDLYEYVADLESRVRSNERGASGD